MRKVLSWRSWLHWPDTGDRKSCRAGRSGLPEGKSQIEIAPRRLAVRQDRLASEPNDKKGRLKLTGTTRMPLLKGHPILGLQICRS